MFLYIGDRNYIHPQPLGSCAPLQEQDALNMLQHNPQHWYEPRPRIKQGTFGLTDECSTTELTFLLFILVLNTNFHLLLTTKLKLRVEFKKWPCRPIEFKGDGPIHKPGWGRWAYQIDDEVCCRV